MALKPAPVMMKPGDAVFFKVAASGIGKNAPHFRFKGRGLGVLLGVVPPGAPLPSQTMLFRLMGQIGFLTFDDVGAFLGDEQAKICIAKFEEKYYGKKTEEGAPDPQLEPEETTQVMPAPPRVTKLVGLDGKNIPATEADPDDESN